MPANDLGDNNDSHKEQKKQKPLGPKDIQRNRDFELAIVKLWKQCPSYREAIDDLHPLIQEDTVKRFYQPDKINGVQPPAYKHVSELGHFDKSQKDRLIWYFSDGPERFVYRRIADTIRQNPAGKSSIVFDAKGDYIYFRYMKDKDGNDVYVNGDISIYELNGIPKFDHRSDEHRSESKPEHSGPIFLGGNYLFLVGTRPEVLRLAICDVPKADKKYVTGLVLSIRSEFPNDPFAARFVMVRREQKDVIDELIDKSPNPNYGIKSEDNIIDASETLGEKKFFEVTEGSYAYFMLSKHR